MNILFLQKRLLYPVNSGWRIRTLNVVKYLARWHRVTYLCNVQKSEVEFEEPMRALGLELIAEPWEEDARGSVRFYLSLARNLVSPYPFTVDKDHDRRLRQRTQQLLDTRSFDVVVCDFVQMARNVVGLPTPPTVLFQHNVEALLAERLAASEPSWPRRQYMRIQSRKMRRFEAAAGAWFDRVVAVSRFDRETFERSYGWSHVSQIDTAVDVDEFQPSGQPRDPATIVFVGTLDWRPNEVGLQHFVDRIWPAVRAAHPSAEFHIIGRSPSPAVQRLGACEGVTVVGPVEDVRPHLDRATLTVVPLLVGSGTRLKIFEAMAMGTPVISTTIGAEGLPVDPGREIVLADDAGDFAAAINQLLSDPARRARLADAARAMVVERFSAETVARQFESICVEAAAHPRPRKSRTV
jgi:glycosyltransferase involved in cell wall biosynthesis